MRTMGTRLPTLAAAAALLAIAVAVPSTAAARQRGVSISNLYPNTTRATLVSDLDKRAAPRGDDGPYRRQLVAARARGRRPARHPLRRDPRPVRRRRGRAAHQADAAAPALAVLGERGARSARELPGRRRLPPARPGHLRRRRRAARPPLPRQARGAGGLERARPRRPDVLRGARQAGPLRRAAEGRLPAAKRGDSRLPVLGGSLVGADGRFLKALYAEGIRGHYDALSVHFYDLSLASIRSIRQVQRAAGDGKPLWLAEFGWTSCYPRRSSQGGHDCVTRERQARSLDDLLRGLRSTSYVQGTIVYNLRDDEGYDFGLVTRSGARKPAFAAVRRDFVRRPPAPRARRSGCAAAWRRRRAGGRHHPAARAAARRRRRLPGLGRARPGPAATACGCPARRPHGGSS